MKRSKIVIVIVCCVFFSSCAIVQEENKGNNYLPSPCDLEELRIGNEIHEEICAQHAVYNNKDIHAYVSLILKKLSLHAERQELVYSVTILYDERIYATSAPGGFIYITTGFLNYLENETELAGILSHEVGRVQYRAQKALKTRNFFKNLSKGSITLGPIFGIYGSVAAYGIQFISALLGGELSEEARTLRADALSFKYMFAASYDPQGILDLFYRVLYSRSEERVKIFFYLDKHPITMERIRRITADYEDLDLGGKVFDMGRKKYNEVMRPIRGMYTPTP